MGIFLWDYNITLGDLQVFLQSIVWMGLSLPQLRLPRMVCLDKSRIRFDSFFKSRTNHFCSPGLMCMSYEQFKFEDFVTKSPLRLKLSLTESQAKLKKIFSYSLSFCQHPFLAGHLHCLLQEPSELTSRSTVSLL